MEMLLEFKSSKTLITIEANCMALIPSKVNLDRKVLIIKDINVPDSFLLPISNNCKEHYVFILPSGEQEKSFENYLKIQKVLLANDFTRSDLIIVLGGGVCGDLGAFVASTYKRGIEFINIPTTTSSMVDSCIGGKTAVNLEGYKNMIGTFYQPSQVFIDFNVLKTLERRHYYAGLVEALKVALLSDEDFVELFNDVGANLEEIVIQALKFKAKIVIEDERETHLRKILNLGHTIGHAIEKDTNYQMIHGEAVALGLIPVIDNLTLCNKVITILTTALYQDLDYKIGKRLLPIIRKDKKSSTNKISVVTLQSIGKYKIEDITFGEMEMYLEGCE